jgi:ubiquitin thioesterase protein OTUB1
MHTFDRDFAVASAKSILESSLSMLDLAGFEKLVYEDFYDIFVSIINQIAVPEPNGTILNERNLLEAFQLPECTLSPIHCLFSRNMRTNPFSQPQMHSWCTSGY